MLPLIIVVYNLYIVILHHAIKKTNKRKKNYCESLKKYRNAIYL